MMKEKETEKKKVELPCGTFCGNNCADGCIYWSPNDRDSKGRQYCSYYKHYYFPKDKQACSSFKKHL